ncbi:MAG: methionine synthase [Promethearchaeota archaeon]
MSNEHSYRKGTVLVACIGQCVHVAGVMNFVRVAEAIGYRCRFTGPATPIPEVLKQAEKIKPEIIGLSYRLTPATVEPLLEEFSRSFGELTVKPGRVLLAGTPEVVAIASQLFQFDATFVGGESAADVIRVLRGTGPGGREEVTEPGDLVSRIEAKKPLPLLRAHLGLPTLEETVAAVEELARGGTLDVISIAPDQNSQAHFFHPEDRDPRLVGAGGVPLGSEEDLLALHRARLHGNYPLLRIYAGTRDFTRLARLYQETIQNAWAAIPVFWFNKMDGRGPLGLEESIEQHLGAIRWHGERGIPVEINDPHHWSLRGAPDAVAVADMYLCGTIAKNLGVRDFVAQYMFNTPPGSSFGMDLAKMLAKDELLASLEDDSFRVIRQVRTGLASFPLDQGKAKGHLAAATFVQLALRPDIVHVVSYCEADHAANAREIAESCKIVEQVVERNLIGELDLAADPQVQDRREQLVREAKWIVEAIPKLASDVPGDADPLLNPVVLGRVVRSGIFDAPHLRGNQFARGQIHTRVVGGACCSWDPISDKKLDEVDRVRGILDALGLDGRKGRAGSGQSRGVELA